MINGANYAIFLLLKNQFLESSYINSKLIHYYTLYTDKIYCDDSNS